MHAPDGIADNSCTTDNTAACGSVLRQTPRSATGSNTCFFPIVLLILACLPRLLYAAEAVTEPRGEVRFAIHITLAPTWFDPGEALSSNTPYLMLYLVHDALVKPMPGQRMAPSLAESWTESPDGLVDEFKLRKGLRFHNGDPFTAEDVLFSFQRYHGDTSKDLHARVQTVEIVDPYRSRFVLKERWPDFMTFYGTIASGAGWIVPKIHGAGRAGPV